MGRKAYLPDIVGPRYALRLGDLGPDHLVHLRCDACRRVALIEAGQLQARSEPYRRMVDLARQFRCAACATATPISWSIYRAAACN